MVSRDARAELVIEAWEMFPNPDWEVVKIFAPSAFELESIQISTQSIPEPARNWLVICRDSILSD